MQGGCCDREVENKPGRNSIHFEKKNRVLSEPGNTICLGFGLGILQELGELVRHAVRAVAAHATSPNK
jgi:hypothetical protein